VASFSLPSIHAANRDNFKNIPCELQFDVPSYTVSGVQVKYFKITEKSNYENFPWVRYLVKNGDYHIRTGLNQNI
jgi:AP-1 complex subunit mu